MKTREFAELYALEDYYWWFIGRRELVRQLLTRYVPDPEALVLDAGCGTGGTLVALKGTAQLIGCDLSPQALVLCRQRNLQHLVAGDICRLPFADNTFAAVISCDVLEHLEDEVAALQELRRVLKPGGFLLLTVPAHRFLWSEHDEALAHRRRYAARELRKKIEAVGLRLVRLSPLVTLMFAPILAFRLAQRLRPKFPEEPRTDLRILPRWLNNLLLAMLRLENWLVRFVNLPIGTSLLVVAQKPACDKG